MREFYGEEKTDMEWKSSSSSKSAAPKPRWVAHCLDSFTEKWQESSVPQLIHWYCDKYKIWRRCLYFVSTCHMQTGMFGHKTLTIQLYRQACMQSWSPPTSMFQVGGLQLYRHACLKYWSPPTSSTRLGGFKLARPSCMYTNQVHISVMSC